MESEVFVHLNNESTEIAILSRYLYRGVPDKFAHLCRQIIEV